MMLRTIFLLAISICFFACGGDDDSPVYDEYKEAWIGNYDCTKSNNSFEDDIFTTMIEVVVEIASDSLLLINGKEVPISEEGTFGPERYEGNFYDIKFVEDSIYMFTYPIVPGLGLTCYINGSKS